MTVSPFVTVEEVAFFERDVRFRMPFRFGVATLEGAPQCFVRVKVRAGDGGSAHGVAAELLAPKWFDKDIRLTDAENADHLRASLAIAAGLYQAQTKPLLPFELAVRCYEPQQQGCAARGLNPLIASFGAAMLDRAVIDAVCNALGVDVFDAVRANLLGIDATLTPDLAGFDLEAFLAGLNTAPSIGIRHTVGLADALAEADIARADRLGDGLPQSLEAAIARYGLRWFKLKLAGDEAFDLDRLRRIAAVLDTIDEPYHVSLDGNEQYAAIEPVLALLEAMDREPALERLRDSILFLEQPLGRGTALERPLGPLAARLPVEIDEFDGTFDGFVEARALGYRGVSAKACKGVYKALLNRARCAAWNEAAGEERFFMSAEDLTTQPGVALQQDLAIATLIGCTHVERNGHHYVDGMRGVPEAEQEAFLDAHPDLYHRADGTVRLTIEQGRVALGSLGCPGFALGAEPDLAAMRPCPYGA